MPAVAKVKCECGCGQAPHSTTRQRLCECVCGRKARQTREWLAEGVLVCPCGGTLEPVCMFDRMCLPGDDGEQALAEMCGRRTVHAVLSERAKRAAETRERRRKLGFYRSEDTIPF